MVLEALDWRRERSRPRQPSRRAPGDLPASQRLPRMEHPLPSRTQEGRSEDLYLFFVSVVCTCWSSLFFVSVLLVLLLFI